MARKGSTKVRTGCFTCKARKVKCDETKPYCRRCTTTGRSCDGYPAPTGQAAYSWADLLTIRDATPAIITRRNPSTLCPSDDMEARALRFFRFQVAPVLSRHSSKNFWNTFVSQVAQQELSVRHALICISSIYEGLGDKSQSLLPAPRQEFAITQYNMALKQLTSTAANNEDIVLLVCLLFICIEAMQGNNRRAIEHCRHGITICNNSSKGLSGWAEQELQPIFLRLATFPYFFGTEVEDFPEPLGLVPKSAEPEPVFDGSSTAWDYLVNRTVRLVRLGVSYRRGPLKHLSVPDDLFTAQKRIVERLAVWHRHYQSLRMTNSLGAADLVSHLYDEMKCIVGKIWAAICLKSDEMGSDEYTEDFEELTRLSQRFLDLRANESELRPKFIFEMGFLPFLYFIVLNCRRLDLRLTALRNMPLITHRQESLFQANVLYAVGRRYIEMEHGIHLDPARPEYPMAAKAPMPPDGARIRSADITEESRVRKDGNGQTLEYRKVFFVIQPTADVPGFVEWVQVGPHLWSEILQPHELGSSPP